LRRPQDAPKGPVGWSRLYDRAVPEALAFQAVLVPHSARTDPEESVVRTIAIRDDQTLEQLHEALRLAFGWADSHLYSFWLSGKFWDDAGEYTVPYELEKTGKPAASARVPIGELGLRKGKTIAYVFDFGDEWRLLLKVIDRWRAGDESYPMLVEAEGVPPPQYPELDEDE
jgi:hypothetical protein